MNLEELLKIIEEGECADTYPEILLSFLMRKPEAFEVIRSTVLEWLKKLPQITQKTVENLPEQFSGFLSLFYGTDDVNQIMKIEKEECERWIRILENCDEAEAVAYCIVRTGLHAIPEFRKELAERLKIFAKREKDGK